MGRQSTPDSFQSPVRALKHVWFPSVSKFPVVAKIQAVQVLLFQAWSSARFPRRFEVRKISLGPIESRHSLSYYAVGFDWMDAVKPIHRNNWRASRCYADA